MDKSIKNIRIEKRFLSITALRIIINFLRGIKDTKKKKKILSVSFRFSFVYSCLSFGIEFLVFAKRKYRYVKCFSDFNFKANIQKLGWNFFPVPPSSLHRRRQSNSIGLKQRAIRTIKWIPGTSLICLRVF